MNAALDGWLFRFFEILTLLGFAAIVLGLLVVAWMYLVDKTQTPHAVRRNYPVIGRFRYTFEHLGEFFRQYFFAMDREELPFNRAERSWVYRAAKDIDSTVAFGSTRDLRPVGSVFFANGPYPSLGEDTVSNPALTIGPDCPHPFATASLFNISGMSYGALSAPAVRALSNGAAMAGCWLNTGEGGLSDYHREGGGDLVFQIGTAKFGVRDDAGQLSAERLRAVADYPHVRMFEIKLSQGAKPGKGGILPGVKITPEIARIRGIPMGQDAISPNRHPEIDSPDALLDMLARVREITGKPAGFKTVVGAYDWLDQLFERINQRGLEFAPDFITIDGAEGGSGAAPQSLIDYMGIPLRESLPNVADRLQQHGLRDRVRLIASGKLITPAEVALALCLGADFTVSARGFLFALGCIQSLQCNRNTCPTGITTHDPRLQRGLVVSNKAQRVANYVKNMQHEVGVIAHSCGVAEPRQLRREHARIVAPDGRSVPLSSLYPPVA